MEKDIEEIKKKIEDFMLKYNVTVEVKTYYYTICLTKGKIIQAKANVIIKS